MSNFVEDRPCLGKKDLRIESICTLNIPHRMFQDKVTVTDLNRIIQHKQ